jgi:hypothetical protein
MQADELQEQEDDLDDTIRESKSFIEIDRNSKEFLSAVGNKPTPNVNTD